MEESEIYELTLEKFTQEHQVIVMIEEMSELTKELVKFLRGKPDYYHLFEELGDVEIVLEQMKLIFGQESFETAKKIKLERLERRLLAKDIEALK